MYRSVFLTSVLDGNQVHAPATLPWGKEHKRKLEGPIMGFDAVKTKNLAPDSCRPTHSLASTSTELYQLVRLHRKNEKIKSKRFRNSAAYFSNELPW
jgi:hypothetical protein